MASEKKDFTCFVHNISPVKKFGPTSYFNCHLQIDKDLIGSVCFAMEKKETLDAMPAQRSPVKISNYNISNKYGRIDVVINGNTHITSTTADFSYKAQNDVISIASLSKVAPQQLVAIKGKITHLSGTKTIVIQDFPVKKQEGCIVDPSGYIKIIFWGEHVDSVTPQSTYFFSNLRMKVSQNQRYLNTPKQDNLYTMKDAEPFKEKLPDVTEISTTTETIAEILGISSVTKCNSCCSCSKKVTIKGKIAVCDNCKMTQKSTNCSVKWTLRIHVQDSNQPRQKLQLHVYPDAVPKLFSICANETTEDEIMETVLNLDTVKVCFGTQTRKLVDNEKINI